MSHGGVLPEGLASTVATATVPTVAPWAGTYYKLYYHIMSIRHLLLGTAARQQLPGPGGGLPT
jgi:hypothetical protein